MLFKLSLFALSTLVHALPSKSHGRDQQAEDGLARSTAILDATTTFLSLLTAEQNASLLYPYEAVGNATPSYFAFSNTTMSGEQFGDSIWTNYPVGIVDRVGLRRDNFTDAQEEAVQNLLSTIMSEQGFQKIQDIMGADQVEEDSGVDYLAGRGVYTLGIFGTPSLSSLWMLQFGGHHLGVNFAMYGSQAVIAPLHTGCLPSLNNVTQRVLAAENDIAFSLVGSLDESLFTQANISATYDVSTLTLGPGMDGVEYPTEGVSVALFSAAQQEMVFELVSQWAGVLNEVHVAPRLAEIKAGLNESYFAWSGPTTKGANENGKSYFRVKGPNLWVEYAPQTNDEYGDLRLHAHSIYRDQLKGYGRTLDQ